MAGVFDSTFVRHRLNEVFKSNHGTASSLHDRFEHHHERATEWRQHGPIFVHHTDEGPTLVKFEVAVETNMDPAAQEKLIEGKLNEVRTTLESMLKPGEDYHLVMEERPVVGDNIAANKTTSYYIKGVIYQK
jgi:hypothetical protein